ncbi:MAG: hypothetical protein IKQ10_06590 [Oscillospiraceae bacterium]|nr:hypothetical protein [Oscillospiraceae bacterium]
MKRALAIILLAILALSLVGCGGEPDPNEGVYVGRTGSMGGISVAVESAFPGGFSAELKSGGKAVLTIDGTDYSVKWAVDGDAIEITAADTTLTGTVSDGVMVLRDVLGSGIDLTLERAD